MNAVHGIIHSLRYDLYSGMYDDALLAAVF